VLKVYMDETGTHDGSPIVAVSAYIGMPSAWRSWIKKWKAAKHPIKVFHSTDCANLRGEFEGWTNERRDSFVANLLSIMPGEKILGVVIAIQMDDLKNVPESDKELLKTMGDPYGCCFQWSVLSVMELAGKFVRSKRIKFIHEVNNSKGEAIKSFQFVRQHNNPRRLNTSLIIREG
jgi:hypothetical protein